MMTEIEKWLSELKVGDRFKINNTYGDGFEIHTISRETKTQFFYGTIFNDGHQNAFRKSDGRVIGSYVDYRGYRYVRPVTQEDHDKIEKKIMVSALKEFNWYKLNVNQLKEIMKLVNKTVREDAIND